MRDCLLYSLERGVSQVISGSEKLPAWLKVHARPLPAIGRPRKTQSPRQSNHLLGKCSVCEVQASEVDMFHSMRQMTWKWTRWHHQRANLLTLLSTRLCSSCLPCKDHLHCIVTAPVTSIFVVTHLSPASYSSIGTVKTTRMATVIWSPICR